MKTTTVNEVLKMRRQMLEYLDSNGMDPEIGDGVLDMRLFEEQFYIWIDRHNCYVTRQPISGLHFIFDQQGQLIRDFEDDTAAMA